jgi:uncharacterized oxidoreductase
MIVIVGASKGLGRELSKVFREEKLLLLSRSDIQITNTSHQHLKTDINIIDFTKIENAIKDNEIKGIFFTTGLVNEKDNFQLSKTEVDEIINTNFLSIIKMNEYFIQNAKLMPGCLICFCSSITTMIPRGKQVVYCASKNALNSYYQSLRSFIKGKKLNLRSALLVLGYMKTEMNLNIKTIFPKKEPSEVAEIIYKNFNSLDGKYYIPFYWSLINKLLNLIPQNIKAKIVEKFNI